MDVVLLEKSPVAAAAIHQRGGQFRRGAWLRAFGMMRGSQSMPRTASVLGGRLESSILSVVPEGRPCWTVQGK
jgi:hypothetical protein